ncbi:hypothetical protein BDV97DRAFT_154973 [Delphinella strobiligena]|nr:hypothetical protein BDV97DRAFT_154973 [Delphinella strobiligena]
MERDDATYSSLVSERQTWLEEMCMYETLSFLTTFTGRPPGRSATTPPSTKPEVGITTSLYVPHTAFGREADEERTRSICRVLFTITTPFTYGLLQVGQVGSSCKMYSCDEFYFQPRRCEGCKVPFANRHSTAGLCGILEEVIGTDLIESCMCRMDQG